MQDFAYSVRSEEIRRELLDAIHGPGAFRHFKSALRRRHIESQWFQFRAAAFRRIALAWCEEHHIPVAEGQFCPPIVGPGRRG